MSVDPFLVSGERLLWSRESHWRERGAPKFLLYLFGALGIIVFLAGLILYFVPGTGLRPTAVLLLAMGPINGFTTIFIVYILGLMAPITFAVTDRRVISATAFRTCTTIQSWLLDDIENPTIKDSNILLGCGVSFLTPSARPTLIVTSQNERDHVLQLLLDAKAQSHVWRQRPNELPSLPSNGTGESLFSMPESLQQLVRSSGGDVRLLSSQSLFKHVWIEAFAPYFTILMIALISLLIVAVLPSPTSGESSAAPVAPNASAPTSLAAPTVSTDPSGPSAIYAIVGMALLVFLFFLHMTLSTGVFGRLSVAITSSKIIFVKTWFGSSVSFGATSQSLRKLIRQCSVTIPSPGATCSPSTGSIYTRPQRIPLPNTLSTYNWILCEAATAPDTNTPLL